MPRPLSHRDYEALAEVRFQIRRFLSFSDAAARATGIEPQQHQLLLAIKGLPADGTPTIGVCAERLQIQHHSAVELCSRAAQNGLVRRELSEDDRRVVTLRITPRGEVVLRDLSLSHRAQLRSAAPSLVRALGALLPEGAEEPS